MTVAVYPRLGMFLRARNWSVAELERQIERRFGRSVDPKTLYRLAADAPIQRADLEIVGAVANVLGVGLGDLFDVRATPDNDEEQVLDPEKSRRLEELNDLQDYRELRPEEQAELDALASEYNIQLREMFLRLNAARRGITVEQARRESDEALAEAAKLWEAFEADPKRRAAVIKEARRRRSQVAD